uniref:photosystem I assembly protein Ycf4 n=1 Tax=Campylotropis capillipes TaxID=2518012 RepID=UPI00208FF499|nr:photosystem I assembly protein Ycf4 [Campylotropis capillipes]YP_010415694.1 photosystem I assembly protein Ycf4 [Campylotropis delavayi]YP_010415777.1 photosystem I assembly protein Ycf4 [Campylotropis grandifolia]YP_010415943.1 photosystem I assembly protein Ycf4 [Campylotropis howellii]YP_010416109.1 photosystem I assembly protein Ycf4 [Campylotropis latifolia]YP_010416275.1 photosystem I assembly protein Ycf4 [Campylotropis pinetorum]YP_010416441.1 photosystem I assembly protein Ycf4 [
MIIILRLEHILVYLITGSRKLSNYFWAFIILLGSLGLLSVAVFSYLGMDFFFLSEEISDFPLILDFLYFPFIPQGATMCFYGIAGLFISLYLWCIILWDVGGGYDIFDKKEKKVCFFRWGFPGKNRRIILEIPLEEIQSIRILPTVQKGGILNRTLTYDIIYMETIEQGFIPLTRIEDDLIPPQIAHKASEVSRLLGVPLLY